MNREECRRHIRGAIVTMPTPFDDEFRLDLGRTREMTQWWVAQGLGKQTSPLKVAAAMGEGPDMSDDEWPALLRTVVNAAGPGATVLCAIQTKNTLHTIEDAKRAQDLGAVGLQIDLPVFHHGNQDDYVRYFTDISDKIDIGIMIYNTFWFGCECVTPETMLRLRDAEHVAAIKWNTPQQRNKSTEGPAYDDMTKFASYFNVIDNSGQPVRCHKLGGAGYISSNIAVYPPHDLKLWEMLEAHRYEEAQAEFDRVRNILQPYAAKSHAKSGGYRFPKGLLAALDRPVGPPRPPTLPMDAGEVAELRKAIKELGWK
jgi:4-hydroxy-tetrahydrodipicolinate synthase